GSGGAGVRRARLPARQRGGTLPARAARGPHLGGHERDPAAHHRPLARAPRRRAGAPLRAPAAERMDLGRLLRPRSVAVVGATDRPGSYGEQTLRNLEACGFEGSVGGVHPTRTEVLGRPCVPSVEDLPEAVDAVVIAIPAA